MKKAIVIGLSILLLSGCAADKRNFAASGEENIASTADAVDSTFVSDAVASTTSNATTSSTTTAATPASLEMSTAATTTKPLVTTSPVETTSTTTQTTAATTPEPIEPEELPILEVRSYDDEKNENEFSSFVTYIDYNGKRYDSMDIGAEHWLGQHYDIESLNARIIDDIGYPLEEEFQSHQEWYDFVAQLPLIGYTNYEEYVYLLGNNCLLLEKKDAIYVPNSVIKSQFLFFYAEK